MSTSLKGLRVVELGRIVSAPWCGQTLADLGADVIKIERPGNGDDMRAYGPAFARDSHGKTTPESGHFLSTNRNKRSVTVDISTPGGQQAIRDLVATSDVVIENYKVGCLERYGLDYASLARIKSDLIYCSITGFGQSGPYAKRPGYDAAFQGMSGMMAVTGEPDGGPQRVGVFVIDQMTGLYAAVAILAALRHRDEGGGGQYIDMALLDVGVAAMAPRTMEWLLDGQLPERLGTKSPGSCPAQVFRCADGYLNIQAGAEHDYRKLCDALGLSELKEDPRFAVRKDRVVNQNILVPMLEERIKQRTVQDLFQDLMERGLVVSPIYTADEMLADPQVVHRDLKLDVPHPTVRSVPTFRSPMRLSKTPVTEYRAPPTIGQHTDEVLKELLGYDSGRIAELRELGAL